MQCAHSKCAFPILVWVPSWGLWAKTANYHSKINRNWRKGWDSNPRWACTHGGFQDRCLKPLGHPSKPLRDLASFRAANPCRKPVSGRPCAGPRGVLRCGPSLHHRRRLRRGSAAGRGGRPGAGQGAHDGARAGQKRGPPRRQAGPGVGRRDTRGTCQSDAKAFVPGAR